MLVVLLIIIAIILFIILKLYLNNRFLVRKFKDNNVIVFGAKGTGKDLLFQNVIRLRKKEKYYSNIDYGYDYETIALKDISVAPNTYDNFILSKITTLKKREEMEGKDIYISDGGIYLPSQYDTMLSKLYPSFPIYYALSRHLYNQNLHINAQALNRIWVKLREQADHYFNTRTSFKIGPFMFTRVIYYKEYTSAEKKILPMKIRGLSNNANRALIEQHRAVYGEIKAMYTVQPIKSIKYDTRYFHKLLFGFVWVPKKKDKMQEDDTITDVSNVLADS